MSLSFKIKNAYTLCAIILLLCCAHASAQKKIAQKRALFDESTERIVIYGIKRRLKQSQLIKHDGDAILDAVTASELGKFPESNIAEALQRIPGVSIDRNGGEGQFVTMRGFGPSFNTVLVNGRRIMSETSGREFSFDLYPAELLSGVQVYKSSLASISDGGIGATVALSTARPLDLADDNGLFSIKSLYDKNSNTFSPQLFGLYSSTFNQGRSGVLFSASHQIRRSQEDFSNTNGWLPTRIDNVPLAAAENANPAQVLTAYIPRETQTGRRWQQRERSNIQLVLQQDLSNDLRLTADGFYNEFTVQSDTALLGSWFGSPDKISNVFLNENGTVIAEDISSEVGILNRLEGRPTKSMVLGLNFDWAINDEWQSLMDLSYSNAQAKQGKGNGQAVIGFLDDPADPSDDFHFINTGNVAEVIYPQVIKDKLGDKSSYLSHVAQYGDQAGDGTGGASVNSDLMSLRLDNSYQPLDDDMLNKIKFGVGYSRERKTVDIVRPAFSLYCMYCRFTVDVPDRLLQSFDNANLLDGVAPNTFRDIYRFDLNEYIAWLTSAEGFAALDARATELLNDSDPNTNPTIALPPEYTSYAQYYAAQPGGYLGTKQPDSYQVHEQILSAYIEANFSGAWRALPWRLNTGLRWSKTINEAKGNQQKLVGLSQGSDTQYHPSYDNAGSGFIRERHQYSNWLPSLNASLALHPDLQMRVAASKTITRPQLQHLSPRFSFVHMRPGALAAVAGNVALKPYNATNIDWSMTYNWGELNNFTLAAFQKRVQDFIVIDNEIVTISGVDIASPLLIPDAAIDEAAGTINFNVQRPFNAKTANVNGIEIAVQYMFDWLAPPFDGLGIAANATFINTNAKIASNDSINTIFAIPGLGNSSNIMLLYDNGTFEANLSWSQRDVFLEDLVNPKAGLEPVFTEKYQQVDFHLAYHFNHHYTLTLDGVNLLNEPIRKHGRFDEQFILYRTTGSRYMLGITGHF